MRLRPEVEAFAQLMERELRANDHKPGWKGCDPLALLHHLEQEVRELRLLLVTEPPRGHPDRPGWEALVAEEGADVGNMSLMIVDVVRDLLTLPEATDE